MVILLIGESYIFDSSTSPEFFSYNLFYLVIVATFFYISCPAIIITKLFSAVTGITHIYFLGIFSLTVQLILCSLFGYLLSSMINIMKNTFNPDR